MHDHQGRGNDGEPPPDAPYDPRPEGGDARHNKVRVKLADGKARTIQHTMATSFWHADGTPMSAQQFMALLFGKLPEFFRDEDELRTLWSDPETRLKLLEGQSEKGFGRDQLAEMQRPISAERSDLFDVLSYVAFLAEPKSRTERAAAARANASNRFTERQTAFVNFVLDQYETQGVDELDVAQLVPLLKLRDGDVISTAMDDLGDVATVRKVFVAFQPALYAARK